MPVVRIRRKGGVVVQGCDVYIGRRMFQGGWQLPYSPWANPFKVNDFPSAGDAVIGYFEWFRHQPDLIGQLHTLKGKTLGCWCEPNICHGHILDWLANGVISPALAALMEARVDVPWALNPERKE